MRYAACLWFVLAGVFPAFAAAPAAIVTLLEGKGSLIRGTGRYALAEGVRLDKGDIVEFAEQSLGQMEFADGAAVAVGPKTRLVLLSVPVNGGGMELFLLQGQIKIATRAAGPYRLATPLVGVTIGNAATVLQADAGGVALFAERGEAKVQEQAAGKGAGKPSMAAVKNGEFYSRKPDQKSEVTSRPPAAFVTGLPRPFLDNLPARLETFKDRNIEPKKAADFTYAEVEAWLKTVPAVRKFLLPRWQAKARDAAFRKALVANLKDHPEWDRILFPEKYEEAAKARAAAAKAGRY